MGESLGLIKGASRRYLGRLSSDLDGFDSGISVTWHTPPGGVLHSSHADFDVTTHDRGDDLCAQGLSILHWAGVGEPQRGIPFCAITAMSIHCLDILLTLRIRLSLLGPSSGTPHPVQPRRICLGTLRACGCSSTIPVIRRLPPSRYEFLLFKSAKRDEPRVIT